MQEALKLPSGSDSQSSETEFGTKDDFKMRFITNITNWGKMKPAIYHGHLAFVDFSRFGMRRLPIYINMVREPLSRLVSHYYFLQSGDDVAPHKVRKRATDNTTFDDCVAVEGPDCGPKKMWVQIPFFCGHHAYCWEPGNEWALEEAKRNLVHHYLVVGITEELRSFLAVLEAALPRFFRGATSLYNQESQLRKTAKKIPPSRKTLEKMERSKAYRMERDFYRYAVGHFHFIRAKTLEKTRAGAPMIKQQQFVFDKIHRKKKKTLSSLML